MRNTTRIVFILFAFVASYFFTYWGIFSIIPGLRDSGAWPQIGSLVVAIAVCIFLFMITAKGANTVGHFIMKGAIITGSIGFIAGFFGPLIVRPDANLGPLIGIFFTGPIGFVLGMIGGAVYWLIQSKKSSSAS